MISDKTFFLLLCMKITRRTKRTRQKSKSTTKKVHHTPKCAPQSSDLDFTCYSRNSLKQLKNEWNKNKKKKITTNDPREIWTFFDKNLKNCENESCWTNKVISFSKSSLLDETFAPLSPEEWKVRPNTWLSSDDITNVMKQYESVYKCFKFIGPSPIDYDVIKSYGECVWVDLCKFNMKDYIEKKKYKIGIIFNLDTHDMPGSHWVSLFINLKSQCIFYFDSTGEKIPKQILKFVKMVQTQGNQLNKRFDFLENSVPHQQGNSECGMYSLYFIINMLKTEKMWRKLMQNRIKDKDVEKCRNVYFNKYL